MSDWLLRLNQMDSIYSLSARGFMSSFETLILLFNLRLWLTLVCIHFQIIFLKSKCLVISSVRSIGNSNGF